MKKQINRKGSALLTVLGIVAVVSLALVSLCFTAQQQFHSALMSRDMLKARMIAESGLNKAYHRIKDDFKLAKTISLSEELSDGSFKVSAKSFDGIVSRAQLTCVGRCGSGRAVVAADLENIQLLVGDDGSGSSDSYTVENDITVGGTLDITGNFHADVDSIHANGIIEINKKSNVSDTLIISSAGVIIWGNGNGGVPAGVTLMPNQPRQEINPAELQAAINVLINHAIENDAVYSSSSELPANPPGGVALYNGTSDLTLHGNYNGSIVVLGGSITINAQATIESPDGYPALVSISPNQIRVNGGAAIYGAVIAPNASMRFNGNAEIHGPLLVGQDVLGNGTADLYAGTTGQGFNLPYEESVKDNVVITAWH
jgi:hypothetical protein